jgi:hypothetical protein
LIALLEEEFEPVEDSNSPTFPNNDMNETLAAFFYDADSNNIESQSTTPSTLTPRLNTLATLTGTQFLK